MTKTEIIRVGEKGQIVIPKNLRANLLIEKGAKLAISEDKGKLIIKKIKLDEDYLWMLAGEETLKKTWDNPYDARWDDAI